MELQYPRRQNGRHQLADGGFAERGGRALDRTRPIRSPTSVGPQPAAHAPVMFPVSLHATPRRSRDFIYPCCKISIETATYARRPKVPQGGKDRAANFGGGGPWVLAISLNEVWFEDICSKLRSMTRRSEARIAPPFRKSA